ncbi:MAG: xanthine dehydrogenase family protein subunit M [Thermoanaerobaculia bacterium]
MIPAQFDYHSPGSLEEALALLEQFGDEAKILAGGHSLIPAMRFRLAMPENLVDINGITDLDYIREEGGWLAIGALTRESALEASSLIQDRYALLADTAAVIADPLVRNLATVGGNLAHADPANDHPATMLAYAAEVVVQGPGGARTIPIDAFFTDLFETSMAAGEILTEIRIPEPGAGSGGAYLKVERKVGDYAISAVAVQLTLNGDTCTTIRIGLTNVNPTPMRATEAEGVLTGQVIDEGLLEAAGQAASEQCDPSPDLRGSVEYKKDLTRVVTKRAIRKAVERAKGAAS